LGGGLQPESPVQRRRVEVMAGEAAERLVGRHAVAHAQDMVSAPIQF